NFRWTSAVYDATLAHAGVRESHLAAGCCVYAGNRDVEFVSHHRGELETVVILYQPPPEADEAPPEGVSLPQVGVAGEGQGYVRSRGNSSKLGLSGGCTVLPKDFAAEVNLRYTHFNCHLRPFDTFDAWLCEVITIDSVRYD